MMSTDDDNEFIKAFLRKSLAQWQSAEDIAGRTQLIEFAVIRANQAFTAHQPQNARETLQGVLDLYGEDETVAKSIAQCRELLAKLPVEPDVIAPPESAESPARE